MNAIFTVSTVHVGAGSYRVISFLAAFPLFAGDTMTTGLELYEALKPTVGEEAARMIAEALPMTERVAMKTDIEALGLRVESRISATEARMFRWMLGFFATLWLGNAGLIVTIVLKF